MKRLLVLLFVIGLLYTGAEFAAMAYAEDRIAEEAQRQDPAARGASADVSFPFLFNLMAKSAVDTVEVEVQHVDIGPFLAESISILLKGVHLNRSESLREREPVVEAIDRVEASVAISSVEASRVLPQGFRFEFDNGASRLLGPGVDAAVRFRVEEGSRLGIEPVSGGRLPQGIPASWELAKVPFVLCLEAISVQNDLLVLTCARDNPPARFPPDVGA